MPLTKISALTSASTPLAGTEVLPIVQSGATRKVANNDLRPRQIQSNATTGVLQVAGPSAGATRVMTTPDANFMAARTDAAQSFTGDQTLATGNLVQGTAGKGFNFTANANAPGMTSELLNWYEEGSWTPALVPSTSGLITLSAAAAKYTRVGRAVTVTGICEVSSVSSPVGALLLQGLPFTNSADTSSRSAAAIYATGLAVTATTAIMGRIIPSESQIRIEKFAAGSASAMAGDVQTNTIIQFNLTYFV
jgi:hypothetical protein